MARKKKKVNLAAKCREANMPYGVVHARINTLGWDVDKAITTPVREKSSPSVVKRPVVQSSTTATAEVVNNVNQRLVGIGIAVAIAVLVIGYFNV